MHCLIITLVGLYMLLFVKCLCTSSQMTEGFKKAATRKCMNSECDVPSCSLLVAPALFPHACNHKSLVYWVHWQGAVLPLLKSSKSQWKEQFSIPATQHEALTLNKL